MTESKVRASGRWGSLAQPRTWLFVAGLLILLPLLFHAYLGLFSRYTADDFCLAWNGTARTFMNAQTIWYKTDSSRFSATLIFTLSDRLGSWTVQALPAFVLALWLGGAFMLVHQLQKKLSLKLPSVASFFYASLWIYFVLLLAPNLYQVLYWRSGMVVYLLPLVILTWLAVFLLWRSSTRNHRWEPLFAGLTIVLFYFNGGFSETISTLQIGMLLLALVGLWLWGRQHPRSWIVTLLGCALLGSVLALATLYFAPATEMRRGLLGDAPSLFNLVRMSLSNAFVFIYITLGKEAFALLILLILGLFSAYLLFSRDSAPRLSPTALVSAMLVMPLITFLWSICVVAPFTFAQSSYPEGRVLVDATIMLVAMVLCEGFLLGAALGSLHLRAGEALPVWLSAVSVLALLGASLFPLYSTRKVWNELPAYQQRAQAWDERDLLIRQAAAQGGQDLVVTALQPFAGLQELSPSPNNWVNGCAALYYGVNSITAKTP